MKKTIKLAALYIALISISSCGIITKTRYGNGLKFNLISKSEKQLVFPASKRKNNALLNKPIITAENKTLKNELLVSALELDHPAHLPAIKMKQIGNFQKSSFIASQKIKTPVKINPKDSSSNYKSRPIEPHVKAGGILFYGSIFGILLAGLLNLPFIMSMLGISLFVGIVFSFIGKRFMKLRPDTYKGYGLMWSVLITCSIFLIISLLNLTALAIMIL